MQHIKVSSVSLAVKVVLLAFVPAISWNVQAAENTRSAPVLGIQSGDDENEANEADPKFRPAVVRFQPRAVAGATGQQATGSAAGAGGGAAHLKDHPKVQELARKLAELYNAREINVALLGGHKYMINDCLGIKVSAGEFKLKFINPTVRLDGTGLVFECGISHLELSAIKLRMRPRVPPWDDPNPCKFSKKFEVGGDVSDVRITMRFDPILDLERCKIFDVATPDTRVRIGNLNLKPLQNNLDAMAKNMVEDAITYFLNSNIYSQMLQTLDDLIEADCPGNPGNARNSINRTLDRVGATGGGSTGSDKAPAAADQTTTAPTGATGDATTPAPTSSTGASPGSGTAAAAPGASTDAAMAARLRELESKVAELEKQAAAGDTPAPASADPARAKTTNETKTSTVKTQSAVSRPAGGGGAFSVVANPELKGRLGRLVVSFPANTKIEGTRTSACRPGEAAEIEVKWGNTHLELLPGTYDIYINGRIVPGVTIQSKHDTLIHVGVLRFIGSSTTRFSVLAPDGKVELQVKWGDNDIGLPAGEYDVSIKDARERVKIAAGAITEF